jgi:hypothetical protein
MYKSWLVWQPGRPPCNGHNRSLNIKIGLLLLVTVIRASKKAISGGEDGFNGRKPLCCPLTLHYSVYEPLSCIHDRYSLSGSKLHP